MRLPREIASSVVNVEIYKQLVAVIFVAMQSILLIGYSAESMAMK
jgi:hypothetical protein